MTPPRKKKTPTPALQARLSQLEDQAAGKGIQVHYDLLEAAGLKLQGGMCKINGEYHIFIDKRKPMEDQIDLLHNCLERPFPDDIPQYDE